MSFWIVWGLMVKILKYLAIIIVAVINTIIILTYVSSSVCVKFRVEVDVLLNKLFVLLCLFVFSQCNLSWFFLRSIKSFCKYRGCRGLMVHKSCQHKLKVLALILLSQHIFFYFIWILSLLQPWFLHSSKITYFRSHLISLTMSVTMNKNYHSNCTHYHT